MSAALKNNRNLELIGFLLIAVTILVVLPLLLDNFRLNLVGKYLTYAFVAVGLVLCWGYTGILSLGQGGFFGLGGYCMAMFLKLEASSVANTKIQSTPGIPDFMDWNQITELPFFWWPFKSLPLALIAVILVPVAMAFILSAAMFTLQVGFMSPSFVGIVPSIEMVIFCAVGGRHSLVGAVVGTLLINWAKTAFSESFPELWLFAMGGLFIAVVLAFPRGLAGLVTDQIIPWFANFKNKNKGMGNHQPSPAPAE